MPEGTEEAVLSALRNEPFLNGPSVARFERDFAKFVGVKHAAAVNNGTNALAFALEAVGVRPGDVVIVPSATFIATAAAVTHIGAMPVFADVDPATMTISIDHVKSLLETLLASELKHSVRALVAVHLYGHACDMDALVALCKSHGIRLVEDCAQAIGAKWRGRVLGGFGDAAAFSFYPTKNMTVGGDGGMVVTNDVLVDDCVRVMRNCGRSLTDPQRHERIGTTGRLNTIQAAIGRLQLRHLSEWNQERDALAQRYRREIATNGLDSSTLTLPSVNSLADHSWQSFVVRSDVRDALKSHLEQAGIECGIHYPIPVHLQAPYLKGHNSHASLPATEEWSRTVLSLPMWPGMQREEQDEVIEAILVWSKGRSA